MNKNIHFYVTPKNGWAWLMAVCLAGSAISRTVLYGLHHMPIYTSLWLQMGLPVAATVLYMLITLCNGREQFYKTAIPPCGSMCCFPPCGSCTTSRGGCSLP